MNNQNQQYYPYMGLEFHLVESIKAGRNQPEISDLHFEASTMYQEAVMEKDFDLKIQKIKKYKDFCKKNKIKAFSFAEKVKAK